MEEQLLKDIASKHGVVISDDDPIYLLYTANKILIEQTTEAQKSLLENYQKRMIEINDSWASKNIGIAENILNSSLLAAQETIDYRVKESTDSVISALKTALLDDLSNMLNSKISTIKYVAWINLFCLVSLIVGFAFNL